MEDRLGHIYYKRKILFGLFSVLTCKKCGWTKRVNDNYQAKCEGKT